MDNPYLFTFDEEKVIFKMVTPLGDRCISCNKKMLSYYNEEYEVLIRICENKKCMRYEATDCVDFTEVDINPEQVILEGYYDE